MNLIRRIDLLILASISQKIVSEGLSSMKKRLALYLISFVLVVSFAGSGNVSAIDKINCNNPDEVAAFQDFASLQDIPFWDPCDSDTSCQASSGIVANITGPAPTSLSGADNAEKTWNYFIARGLTPIAAAGAIGNIKAESNFSAAVEEASGGGGIGIIQWTGDRRDKLEEAAVTAGVSLTDNDSALLFELDYFWDGEYNAMTWQEQMNAETTVEGNTAIASYNSAFSSTLATSQAGNGSTMVFHSLVERSGDVPTEADRISGYGVLTGRIDNAKMYLQQFGESGAGNCSISAGGLTWDQAVAAAKKISDNWDGIFCGNESIKSGFYCSWKEGYCTAGAAWMAETTAPDPSKVPGIPNGVDVANRLISSNSDVYTAANADGSNLQPFSVWSFGEGSASGQPGHTGTIVGIGSDGSIITLEANWAGKTATSDKDFLYSGGGNRVAVFQYPSFDAFKNSHNGYTYTATATPKDSATASEMGARMTSFLPGGNY
jgi:hypothetical protein